MAAWLIAQIGFGSLFMLSWMAAGLIPIVLYFLRKRSRSTVPWAAMRLLQQVVLQESRRSHLQQLLLLFTRIAIMLVLGLGLARPFLEGLRSDSSPLQARTSRLILFAIDTSYSMGYRDDQTTRLDLAKERVGEMVRESQLGDAFALVVLDRPSRPIIRRPTFDPDALLDEVRRLSDTALDCDLESGLAIISDMVADAKRDPSLPKTIEVVILSDLGADNWSADPTSPVSTLLSRLDQLARVTVESLAVAEPVNQAILSVVPSTSRAIVGQPLRFDVKLAAVGDSDRTTTVRLEQDGRVVASSEVELLPGQTTDVPLQTISRQEGQRQFSVVIPPDNLAIDNRRDVVVDVQKERRILIVASNSSRVNAWALALDPPGLDSSGETGEIIRVASQSEWLSLRLQDWDVLILDNPSLNVPNQLNRVRAYTEAGGVVIIALGPKLWSDASARTRDNLGQFIGLDLREPSQWGDWTLDPLEYTSPVVSIFEGFPSAGLLTTPIYRFWQAEVVSESVSVDLGLTDGSPLLFRKRGGRGAIGCLLTAPQDGRGTGEDPSWSAMTSWPSFLPLARQLVQALVDTHSDEYNRVAGQALSGSVDQGEAAVELVLQRPDQSQVSIFPDSSGAAGQSIWTYAQTDQRGVYRIVSPEANEKIFAVNIDPKQSRLQSIDPSSLPIRGQRAGDEEILDSSQGSQAAASDASFSDNGSRLLLLCLAALLIGESLLACFLGRSGG